MQFSDTSLALLFRQSCICLCAILHTYMTFQHTNKHSQCVRINVTTACRHGKPCYLLVGPEGDFTTSEVQMMVAAGVQPVGLGDLRLRTETAALALLTAAMLFESSTGRYCTEGHA